VIVSHAESASASNHNAVQQGPVAVQNTVQLLNEARKLLHLLAVDLDALSHLLGVAAMVRQSSGPLIIPLPMMRDKLKSESVYFAEPGGLAGGDERVG
jgi:hypothetical protein